MTFLILHKVRGEPAFDIADKVHCTACDGTGEKPTTGAECYMCDGAGHWWIIPTSGHRAYPYQHWRFEDLADTSDIDSNGYHDKPWTHDVIPADWPDHYPAKASKAEPKAKPTDLLAKLGLLPKPQAVRRI